MERFLRALLGEIDLVGEAAWAGDITIGTVFFGGGTPSLLEAEEMENILDRLRKRFALAPVAEVTVECNPESLTREKAEGYRLAGVNRLSLGVQSLDDDLLLPQGPVHDEAQALLRQGQDDHRAFLPGLPVPRPGGGRGAKEPG
jgi:oxygen-independent coproporphyrinogen-3 oxidase